MKVKQKSERIYSYLAVASLLAVLLFPTSVYAMHIMEGFLPVNWAIAWAILSLPFLVYGIKKMNEKSKSSHMLSLMALAGAFVFVLSAMKIPSVTGSCSHPTGSGLAAILFGPAISSVLAAIVLLFQAVLLAHGGLTTLGANIFSMGIVGPIFAYYAYRLIRGENKDYEQNKHRTWIAVFVAAAGGDLITYVITSLQLALAHPGENMLASFTKFATVFAVTQIPLAIVEGIITVIIFSFIAEHNREELSLLQVSA